MMLEGRVALITGAASGIGRASAILFAQHGARVAILDINESGGKETEELVRKASGEGFFLRTDVADSEQIRKAVDETVERYGRLDIVYSNAVYYTRADATQLSEENWHRTLDVSLKPAYSLARFAVPHLRKNGVGVILITGSVQAIRGYAGYLAYQAAKGGLSAMTRAMAAEFAPEIRVNCILPGAIVTGLWEGVPEEARQQSARFCPLQRNGLPEDVANAALFLVSDMSSYITGTELAVDGGLASVIRPPEH